MSRVLLLVDLQNDFLRAPGLEPSRGELVRRVALLLEGCRAAGIPVMHTRTTVAASGAGRMPHWRSAERLDCVEGTPGHQPPNELRPGEGEPAFDKTFFSAFSAPGLAEELADRGARELLIAGVHLHGCVRATAIDAYALGLEVTIAADATGSYDGLHAAVSRQWLRDRAIGFATVENLLDRFDARIAGSPSDDADRAETAARTASRAVEGWRAERPRRRTDLLERAADLMEERVEELAASIVVEIGKPITYARAEVRRGAALLRAVAASPPPVTRAGPEAEERRLPLGVVAQITPWNNPLAIPLGKLAPALSLGNAVVWKPSPLAARTAREVLALLLAAGMPEGLIAIVEGGATTADAVCNTSGVSAVSITGSSTAGYSAQAICARRRIPIQAELGGNNAAIVADGCNLAAAAEAICEAGFGSAGQRCTANRRVVVDDPCFDAFLDRLRAATAALPLGDPRDPETHVGPLVNAAAASRVLAALERAVTDGAEVMLPGAPRRRIDGLAEPKRYLEPALVLDAAPDSEIVQRETFGPVVVLQRASGFEHALELANGVDEGLVSALFSDSRELQQRFLDGARAGVLKLNQATADVGVETPFGGWGTSGVGPPEHGSSNVDFYTRPQAVYR